MTIIAVGIIAIIIVIIIKIFKNKTKKNKICDLVYFFDGISPFNYRDFQVSERQTQIQKETTWTEEYATKESCWVGFISEISEYCDEISVKITIYYGTYAWKSFSIDLNLPKSQKEKLLSFHKYDGVRFKFKFARNGTLHSQKLEKIGVKEFEFKRFLSGDN